MQSVRMKNTRGARNGRRRRESEEEPLQIDLSRPAALNVPDFLWRCCQRDGVSRGQKVAYLNALTRLLADEPTAASLPLASAELMLCLRTPLLSETREVRAAGYRTLRYAVRGAVDVDQLVRCQIPVLAVRSLELAADGWQLERVQAARLVRRLLAAAPDRFPDSLTRCLLALVADAGAAAERRDRLWMLALATLAEMAVRAGPQLVACGGAHVLLRAVLDSQQPRVVDALLSVLLRLADTCQPPPDFSLLLSPLTESHFSHHAQLGSSGATGAADDRSGADALLQSAQMALVSLMRSWSGLLRVSSYHAEALHALVGSLQFNRPELRRVLIRAFFELLDCDAPDFSVSAEQLMSQLCSGGQPSDACRLYENFVAEEASLYLPHLGDTRPDLVANFMSLLVYTLLNAGLLDSLAEVVVSSEQTALSLAAVVLMYELLSRAEQLPPECLRQWHCLPALLQHVASASSADQRRVSWAVDLLHRVHSERRRRCGVAAAVTAGCSLFFRQQLGFYGLLDLEGGGGLFERAVQEASADAARTGDGALLTQLSGSCSVLLTDDPAGWDWQQVACLVRSSSRPHQPQLCAVLRRLCAFVRPTSHQFFRQPVTRGTQLQARVLSDLLAALASSPPVCDSCCRLLDQLVLEMTEFMRGASDSTSSGSAINANALVTSCARFYFLLVGRVASSRRGGELLDKHGTRETLTALVQISERDDLVKLVLSSLDFGSSADRWPWRLLERCLAADSETKRLYSTRHLLLLARARCASFGRWGVELLLAQLCDAAPRVAAVALQVLDEACDYQPFLDAVVGQQPNVLTLGDGGVLLFARLVGSETGFRQLERAGLMLRELDRWRDGFCCRYATLLERRLSDSLSRHQSLSDGEYGRRTAERDRTRPVHLPPHLHGELCRHRAGLQLLQDRPEVAEQLQLVRQAAAGCLKDVQRLKSALWTVGSVGRTGLGADWLLQDEQQGDGVVKAVVSLAAQSSHLAVRATSCLVLGLLGSTPQGAAALSCHGWQAVCRSRSERSMLQQEKRRASVTTLTAGLPEEDDEDELSFVSTCSSIQRMRSVSDVGNGRRPPSLDVSRASTLSPFTGASNTSSGSSDSLTSHRPSMEARRSFSYMNSLRSRIPPKLQHYLSKSMSPPRGQPGRYTLPAIRTPPGSGAGLLDLLEPDRLLPASEETASPSCSASRVRLDSLSERLSSSGGPCSCRVRSRRGSLATVKRFELQPDSEGPAYVGLALPYDLHEALMRRPPSVVSTAGEVDPPYPTAGDDPRRSSQPAAATSPDSCWQYHDRHHCLRCFTLVPPRLRTDTESSTESSHQPLHQLPEAAAAVGADTCSLSSAGSCETSSPGADRTPVRRELLRLVGTLGTGVAARSAEQGLLGLKQRFPALLRTDICLYSELHYMLSAYNFRLGARRFLQELFEDLVLEDVGAESIALLTACRPNCAQ